MIEPYVLDSNIIIYYLNDVLNELASVGCLPSHTLCERCVGRTLRLLAVFFQRFQLLMYFY